MRSLTKARRLTMEHIAMRSMAKEGIRTTIASMDVKVRLASDVIEAPLCESFNRNAVPSSAKPAKLAKLPSFPPNPLEIASQPVLCSNKSESATFSTARFNS